MKFDFDHAAKLAKEDPDQFEIYRIQQLYDYMALRPKEKQQVIGKMIDEMSEARDRLNNEEFLQWTVDRMKQFDDELDRRLKEVKQKLEPEQHEVIRVYVRKP